MKKHITLSSFRVRMLEAMIQFSEQIEEEPEESSESRTMEEWWDEFRLYMEEQ